MKKLRALYTAEGRKCIAAFFVFLLQVILLQYLAGAYSSEFGGAKDEAPHYVTALMVRAFILSGSYGDPMSFAADYYLHYPKVAMGHWPPLLHTTLGAWLTVFGVSRAAAIVFIALLVSASATGVFLVARHAIGPLAGWVGGTLLIALPLVQTSSSMVMTESLVMLSLFLSALAFARFMATQRMADSMLFALFASAAILSRGSGWSLALLPPLALLLSGRLHIFRLPAFWLSAVPVALLCVPWYVITLYLVEGLIAYEWLDFPLILQSVTSFSHAIAATLGLALLIPCALGIWCKLVSPRMTGAEQTDPLWAALFAMALVTVGFHTVVPAGTPPRYMVPTLPVFILFSLAGVNYILEKWTPFRRTALTQFVVLCVFGAGFAFETFTIPQLSNGGYRVALETAADNVSQRKTVVLVASGTIGEGSVVTAAAEKGDARLLILRGSKIFVEEDWMGRNTKNRFDTPGRIFSLLESIPVDSVILDSSLPANEQRTYHQLLRNALEQASSKWKLSATFPVRQVLDKKAEDALSVYTRREVQGSQRPEKIDVGLIRSLTNR